MKSLVLSTMIAFTSVPAFAGHCYSEVAERLTAELERKGWAYHGVEQQNTEKVLAILEQSEELSSDQRSAVGKHLQKGGAEFYLLTGTADYSAGFQELFIVNAESCRTVRRMIVYVE